jgi:hypothetical protein
LIRLPFLAAGLAIYFGVRFLARRSGRKVIRLRNGRRVRLLSSVALLEGSASDLLALEYFSASPDAAPEELRLEARSLVQTVGARAEYATCRRAVVAVRRPGGRRADAASPEHTFTFRRGDSGSDWYPADGLP